MIKRYGIPTRRSRLGKGNLSEGRNNEMSDEATDTIDSASSEVFEAINEELRKQ